MTLLRMKEFLGLLYVAPIAYFTAVSPILKPMSEHIKLALAVSQADPWAKRVWWDWFGSWIFVGGPFGRWIFGTILGYRILKPSRHRIGSDNGYAGQTIEEPHLRVLIAAAFGFLLCTFALVNSSISLRRPLSNDL